MDLRARGRRGQGAANTHRPPAHARGARSLRSGHSGRRSQPTPFRGRRGLEEGSRRHRRLLREVWRQITEGVEAAARRPAKTVGVNNLNFRNSQSLDIELLDRKSTRLNSSHSQISYAVFCLKKKKKQTEQRS